MLVLCFIEGILFASIGMLATALAKELRFFHLLFHPVHFSHVPLLRNLFPLQGLPKYLMGWPGFFPHSRGERRTRRLHGRSGPRFWKEMAWLAVVGVLINWIAVKKMEKRLYV